MKKFFLALSILFATCINAQIYHTIDLDDTKPPLSMYVAEPDQWAKKESKSWNFVFEDIQTKQRQFRTNCYVDPFFEQITIAFLYEHIWKLTSDTFSAIENISIKESDFSAVVTFTGIDSNGKHSYCYMAVNHWAGDLIATIMCTHPENLQKAEEDYTHFHKNVFWLLKNSP